MPRALSEPFAPRRGGPRAELFFSAGHAAAAAYRCRLAPGGSAASCSGGKQNPEVIRPRHARTHRIFSYQYAPERNPAQIKV